MQCKVHLHDCQLYSIYIILIVFTFIFAEGTLGEEIRTKFKNDEQFMVTVLKAYGEEQAIATKAMNKDKTF